MTESRKGRTGQTGTEVVRDPYGQKVEFNGRHVTADDYEGKKIESVPKDSDEELAAKLRREAIEQASARYGLPALIVAWILLEFVLPQLT